MERKEILKVAEVLKLDIKKNWSSEKIKGLIEARLSEINGVSPDLVILDEAPKPVGRLFCGVHPITGEQVFK